MLKRIAPTKEQKQAAMRERMITGSRNGKHGRYKRTLATAWQEIKQCEWMIGYDGPSPTPVSTWALIQEHDRLHGGFDGHV